ncbi:hypothetical protein VSR68_11340 [Paraburkholderia phymatum]|uniref:hypothetical protein n=1 Tax=Paraburkholderia phymatum TaxID=148447 RepID=UPI003181B009
MKDEPIEVIRRRRLIEEIAEWRHLHKHKPFCGWAALMLFDDIREVLQRLNGIAGNW